MRRLTPGTVGYVFAFAAGLSGCISAEKTKDDPGERSIAGGHAYAGAQGSEPGHAGASGSELGYAGAQGYGGASGGAGAEAHAAGAFGASGGGGAEAQAAGAAGVPGAGEQPVTSSELIAVARASGSIDAKTGAYLELLANFSPSRLPVQFAAAQATREPLSAASIEIAAAHIGEYGASEAAAIRAMLASPTDPAWLKFPADIPKSAAGEPAASCLGYYDVDNPGAVVVGSPKASQHFIFRAVLPASSTIAEQGGLFKRMEEALAREVPAVAGRSGKVTLLEYFDQVFDYYMYDLSMKDPSSIVGGPLIPVYVGLCDAPLNTAHAKWTPIDVPPYRKDAHIFASVQLALEHPMLSRVVIPHEVFHVIEYAYGVKPTSVHLAWPYDASAVAVEDLVAPDVQRWTGRYQTSNLAGRGFLDPMDRSFKCPEEPLHSDGWTVSERTRSAGFSDPCYGRITHYSGSYSKFALMKFLMRAGRSMSTFWSDYASAGGDPTSLVTDVEASTFQIAMLAEPDGTSRPRFSQADRAAFREMAGLPNVDFDANDPNRYTYTLKATDLLNRVGSRVTPSDVVSKSVLTQLDNSFMPIPTGGTHRLLLELPTVVPNEMTWAHPFEIVFTFENADKASLVVLGLDRSGDGPSAIYSTKWPLTQELFSSAAYTKWARGLLATTGESLPAYYLINISNHGSKALTYKASVALPQRCVQYCVEHYQEALQHCPEGWCAKDEPAERQACINAERAELPRHLTGILSGSGLCGYVCSNGPGGLEYNYESYTAACEPWSDTLCKSSNVLDTCFTEPSGFVPLNQWPSVECAQISQGGSISCSP